MKHYQVALYIRLSKEDDRDGESNSIMMQRMLLRKYAWEHFPDCKVQEFCDDGYTGTNFGRPGVQKLLEEVRDLKINCIIVKDFSRFARDYIELGSYLEQIFPFLGVRFISVNDHYDSKEFRGSIADLDVNFKNLLYDLYSRDLSQKVRSSLAVRKEQGQYVSANAPFGYEKDPNDRHGLVIAEDEAEVVRKIFALTVEGYTSTQIARLFNENHVKTPVEFKMEKGQTTRKPKGERFLWSSSVICQILRNEVYIGNVVQKKYEKDFVGGRNHLKPREEWIVTCNHHKPIIDREMFYMVQEGRGMKRPPQYRTTHPLTGKAVCGCCHKNLRCRSSLNPYFTCHSRYSTGLAGCVDKVNAMFLEQYVLYKMQEKMETDGELEKLHKNAVVNLKKELAELRETKKQLGIRIEKERQHSLEAYQEYASGRTDSFQSGGSGVRSMEKELADLNGQIEEKEAACMELQSGRDSFGVGSPAAELSKELIEKYIDRIVVYDESHIEIVWKGKAEVDKRTGKN